ncbi:MAG: hypothetical protein KA810_16410, partial [Pyrinomonadaceae bacterium]|nr:hypothetical protein [Pyrinomonadaceae bacterium]
QEIGKTTMGVPFVYATISSPENLKTIKKYEDINAKLADPRKIKSNDAAAKALIKQGKTIVLITCGIHSTEVGSTLSSMLIAHRLVSSNEPEIQNILKNTIVLLVPSLNPDGVDIVKNWYDKTLGTPYEGTTPPELYHKYVGHDNNRDWYAFTQVETQLTVDKIHNVWHPQIVHDIHQQGANGARLFLPPYMAPVEPNVPKQIVEGYTELGNAMAADLRSKGFEGITTNTTYDAWTPARAYSHYHGGVRILSETASARIASPITIKFEDLRGASGGLDAKKESPNFGPLWKGGEWKLRNITDYMTGAAFSLLNHAANNREKWLSRFYEVGKEAVRPRKTGEETAYILDQGASSMLLTALERGGVEIFRARKFTIDGKTFPDFSAVISTQQPYFGFAKALLERQSYPDLRNDKGEPITPYDVTAHSLALLTNTPVDKTKSPLPPLTEATEMRLDRGPCVNRAANYRYRTYRSKPSSMDEGWTRWIFENYSWMIPNKDRCEDVHQSISDDQLRTAAFTGTKAIIFPDQSASQVLNGYAKGSMPDELTGGVGKEGVANLKKFVEDGGTLVFLNESSNFAIEQFNLPIKNVTKGLPRKDFYIPGSILRTELRDDHPITKGMPKESIAWFEDSPVFDYVPRTDSVPRVVVSEPSTAETQTKPIAPGTFQLRFIATYPNDPSKILLSGWALGAEKIAGKAALVEVRMGKGKIILFGFRPQYRGQSLATFPLLFNAISQ